VFGKRKAAKELAARDDAVRAYVETLGEPDGTFSQSEDERLTEFMREHEIPPWSPARLKQLMLHV
jgi:hypothetical protein